MKGVLPLMSIVRKRGFFESSRILYLSIDAISPNPNQPRTRFSRHGLEELSASIRAHGILQPLSVRKTAAGYELISGERRLRAAKMAGMTQVPCLLVSAGEMESSLLALIENLQRRDLDFVEEAAALSRLITSYHLSQEEAAKKLGKSQSAIANKLRILKLSPEILNLLRENELSERHARALLRLPEEQRLPVARVMVEQKLTVAKADELIDRLLSASPPRKKPKQPTYLIQDIRFFLNSLEHGMSLMRQAGFPVSCGREDTDSAILLTISIPKQRRP